MISSGFLFFFFNDTATTEIYTLSLHDALPISDRGDGRPWRFQRVSGALWARHAGPHLARRRFPEEEARASRVGGLEPGRQESRRGARRSPGQIRSGVPGREPALRDGRLDHAPARVP